MSRSAARATWLVALTAAGVALAAPRVQVQVAVVHASNQGTAVDPPLQAMKAAFSHHGLSYKSYRQLFARTLVLEPGHVSQVPLPNGRTATLELEKVSGNVAHIHVRVSPLETTYTPGRAGSMFLQAGPYQGGMLILVLSPAAR